MAEEIPVRATGPLQTMSQKGVPPVTWEHNESRFRIFLKGVAIKPSQDPEEGAEVFFRPPVLYSVQLRKAGSKNWGPGFILPVSSVGLSNLEPGRDYECRVQEVDSEGKSVADGTVYTRRFRVPGEQQ